MLQDIGQQSKAKKIKTADNKKVLGQLENLLEQLHGEGSMGNSVDEPGLQFVLTIDRSYLSDPSLADLMDGEYCVLGKVTKALKEDDLERINLLRKTSLGKVNATLFESLKSSWIDIQQVGFGIPQLVTEISAPAVQVAPIAIFA